MRLHRYSQTLLHRQPVQNALRETAGLGPKQDRVSCAVTDVRVPGAAPSGQGVQASRSDSGEKVIQCVMLADTGEFMVIQPGATQFAVFEFEAERVDQMQIGTAIGTQTDYIARIRWDFGLVQDDVKQEFRLSVHVIRLVSYSFPGSLDQPHTPDFRPSPKTRLLSFCR